MKPPKVIIPIDVVEAIKTLKHDTKQKLWQTRKRTVCRIW